MIALFLTDASRVALAVLLVFIFLMLIVAAIAGWLEDHAPIRDEDEELADYYAGRRRLPL